MTTAAPELGREYPLVNGEEDFTLIATTVRAQVFGILVELAKDWPKAYRSDLYHDAQWLAGNVNGEMTFPYMVREYGTQIGDDSVNASLELKLAGVVYDIAIKAIDGRRWTAFVKRRD